MTDSGASQSSRQSAISLEVRRTIEARAERVFAAWTDPRELAKWWGTPEIACIGAEMDLRVGGHYRIGNKLPDGGVLWIAGEFEEIVRPQKLVFTWGLEHEGAASERVTVRFEARGPATEVIVTHERIRDQGSRERHEYGWRGCLEGLARYLAG